METPSEKLAKLIADRLITEKVLSPKQGAALQITLGQGMVKPEDWRSAIEMSKDEIERASK